MPKKCESCRFYASAKDVGSYFGDQCFKVDVWNKADPKFHMFMAPNVQLDAARDICDREGDGHFVYFEPKTPAAGAFVQIESDRPKAMKAAA